jgi:glycosyltransferase involved in cell wall biosynthesis
VPSGIDPDEVRRAATSPLGLRARLALAPGTPLAVNVAALEPSKDQLTLIRAAHRARTLCPELRWAIAGEGPERGALTALVGRLGLGDRVHLLGHVEQVDALLAESDVVVMSSRAEGLGTVVLRAVALGKPVVATRAGGLPEIVAPEWLVPVGDADALARTVVQALERPAPPALAPQFTASAMAHGVLALYRSLV